MTVKLLVGDVRDRIKEIPDGSVDLVACSPPFLALRKYGENAAEMGSERTPADFLDALLELTQEFRRVLAPHGSIAIELGDTYSGSGGGGGDYNAEGLRAGQPKFDGSGKRIRETRRESYVTNGVTPPERRLIDDRWPLAKSLTLIPTLYPASLAYGWNMLNPAYTFPRWRVRNVIVWARPNPPVGALGDKVRPATSYITVACTSARRFFDLDAVRTVNPDGQGVGKPPGRRTGPSATDPDNGGNHRFPIATSDPAGAPPLDWWEDDDPTGHATLVLPTAPFKGAHYATWPEALASRLIKMMCPLRVCTTCGEPSRRIVGETKYIGEDGSEVTPSRKGEWAWGGTAVGKTAQGQYEAGHYRAVPTTLGWSDCGCEACTCVGHDHRGAVTRCKFCDCDLASHWRPGMVLDPFAGSGTTLAVAQGLARDATGIELYEANADLVRQRVGMFLDVA